MKKKRKNKRNRISQSKLFLGLFVLLGVVGILFSPLFAIKNIQMTELEFATKAEICEKIELKEGNNLFFFSKRKAKNILEESPYIYQAKITRKLPDTMVISIQERNVCGYVPYMGAYLYIDQYGRVLDSKKDFTKHCPVVEGLAFSTFQIDEILPVTNKESLEVVVKMSQMMDKYKLLDMVLQIDVSDPKNITASVNKVEIKLGTMEACNRKVQILAKILETIPKEDRGILDLRDLSKMIVFQYLT